METTYRRLKESLDNRKNKNIEQKVRNRHMQLLNIFCKEIKEKHKNPHNISACSQNKTP